MYEQLIVSLLPVAIAGIAAWGGVKVSLNGTRERVQRIEEKLDHVIENASETREKLAYIEGHCPECGR